MDTRERRQMYPHSFIWFLSCCWCLALCASSSDVPQNVKGRENKPEQIHLSLGSSPTDVTIMWSSREDGQETLEYGHNASSFLVESEITELSIKSENAAKFIHRVALKNLTPGQKYWYTIISSMGKTRTENITFQVPHNDSDRPHNFLVVADMGLATKSLPFLVHEILNGAYEVVFHIGDIAYNLDFEGGSIGDQYMNKIAGFTSKVPYLTTPGDHERANDFYHYRHRFSMPNAPWPMKADSLWYSLDIGHTHFVSINTELQLGSELSQAQLKWLRADLAQANRNRERVAWIIVLGHKPLYCTKSVMEQFCDRQDSPLRQQLEDVFFEQGVDLYLSGHKHCYERSWPMYRGRVLQTNTINPMAPIYIISGSLGYSYIVDQQLTRPYWLAFATSNPQKELYAKLNVLNKTHLIWSVHAVYNNEDIEHVQVIQNHHGSFGQASSAVFDKLQVKESKQGGLPPEPFFLVDVKPDNQFRRIFLYLIVLLLALALIAFSRTVPIRRLLKFR